MSPAAESFKVASFMRHRGSAADTSFGVRRSQARPGRYATRPPPSPFFAGWPLQGYEKVQFVGRFYDAQRSGHEPPFLLRQRRRARWLVASQDWLPTHAISCRDAAFPQQGSIWSQLLLVRARFSVRGACEKRFERQRICCVPPSSPALYRGLGLGTSAVLRVQLGGVERQHYLSLRSAPQPLETLVFFGKEGRVSRPTDTYRLLSAHKALRYRVRVPGVPMASVRLSHCIADTTKIRKVPGHTNP